MRTLGSKNKVIRDRCRRGHLRTPENTKFHAVTGRICCRECERLWHRNRPRTPELRRRLTEYMRGWRDRNRAHANGMAVKQRQVKTEWVRAWKEVRGCSVCGERRAPCLEFHHRDPELKEANISTRGVRWTLEHLRTEVEKCDVVCANCHRMIHFGVEE